jgi:hypothetical protein
MKRSEVLWSRKNCIGEHLIIKEWCLNLNQQYKSCPLVRVSMCVSDHLPCSTVFYLGLLHSSLRRIYLLTDIVLKEIVLSVKWRHQYRSILKIFILIL